MVKINFTEEEIEKLRYERFNHPHPRVQLKMEALLLKSQGLKHKNICKVLGNVRHLNRIFKTIPERRNRSVKGIKFLQT